MELIKYRRLSKDQKKQVRILWNKEYPASMLLNNDTDLEKYLGTLQDKNHILIIDKSKSILGWFCDFIREGDKWFIMIIDASIQRSGYGKQLLKMAQASHKELSGWIILSDDYKKTDGTPYQSPVLFYKKNNFKILRNSEQNKNGITTVKIKWKTTKS